MNQQPMSALAQAITLWRQDRAIPMTLFAKLVEAGHDVPTLEAAYRR